MLNEPPFEPFLITAEVLRFEGASGWHHVRFPSDVGDSLRPLVTGRWPALMKVTARIQNYEWTATVMPIKDGPLFIALTAKVRKRLGLSEGDWVTLHVQATLST